MWITIKRKIDFEFGSGKPPLNPGRHNLTDEQFNQWFVPGLISSGDIVVEEQMTPTLKSKNLNYGKYEVFYGGAKPVVSIAKEEVKTVSREENLDSHPVSNEIKEVLEPVIVNVPEPVIVEVKEDPGPVVIEGQRRKRT